MFQKTNFENIIGNYTICTLEIITLFLQVLGPLLKIYSSSNKLYYTIQASSNLLFCTKLENK